MYLLQAIAAEAPNVANQPAEQAAGMTVDIIRKLQDKAEVLTRERKNRGRNVPEELTSHDYVRNFRILATHAVRSLVWINETDRLAVILTVSWVSFAGFTQRERSRYIGSRYSGRWFW